MFTCVRVCPNVALIQRLACDANNSIDQIEDNKPIVLKSALESLAQQNADPSAVMFVVGGDVAKTPKAVSDLECGIVEMVDDSDGPLPLSWLSAFVIRMERWALGEGHVVAFFGICHTFVAALLYKVSSDQLITSKN